MLYYVKYEFNLNAKYRKDDNLVHTFICILLA